jgi:hypothetical protein
MRFVRGLCAAVVAVVGVGHVCADDPKAVIAKGIKAVGGEEKIVKMPAMTWKETGTYHGMGQPFPYTGNYAVQLPDKFRMEIEGIFTIVVNGDKGWENGDEMEKDKLADQKENQYALWVASLVPLKDSAFNVSSLPETKVNNRPAVGIKVTRPNHRDVQLYFDKDSGLLVKSATRVRSQEEGGKEVNQETYFENHKDVDGLKMATKIMIKRDDKPYVEAEMSELKRADKLDAKLFEKPQ